MQTVWQSTKAMAGACKLPSSMAMHDDWTHGLVNDFGTELSCIHDGSMQPLPSVSDRRGLGTGTTLS